MLIKMIALDMDGTTLNSKGELSPFTKETIEKALALGIEVIVSTGRAFTALPEPIYSIKSLKYAVTSNGACIMDLTTRKAIYGDFLSKKTLDRVIEIEKEYGIWLEVFAEGKAYISKDFYMDIKENECNYRNKEYVLKTRIPVEDIFMLMHDNEDKIENINFFFESVEQLEEYRAVIEAIPEGMITSSFPNNLEVGGRGTSKKKAIAELMKRKGLVKEELMCMGDAPNDIEMIKFAGVGVAMENAWGDTKKFADYITDSNDNDGVAKAIVKFAL